MGNLSYRSELEKSEPCAVTAAGGPTAVCPDKGWQTTVRVVMQSFDRLMTESGRLQTLRHRLKRVGCTRKRTGLGERQKICARRTGSSAAGAAPQTANPNAAGQRPHPGQEGAAVSARP